MKKEDLKIKICSDDFLINPYHKVKSDDLNEMESEARKIAALEENIYVTIPITNTEGSYTHRVIERLSNDGIPVNVTAIFTPEQVMAIEPCLSAHTPSIVSVFAGCISDTGRDPAPILEEALWILERKPQTELLWHGCREVYNIIQANTIGCHIISVPDSILKKLDLLDYDLEKFSLDMVRQFYDDAVAADFTL